MKPVLFNTQNEALEMFEDFFKRLSNHLLKRPQRHLYQVSTMQVDGGYVLEIHKGQAVITVDNVFALERLLRLVNDEWTAEVDLGKELWTNIDWFGFAVYMDNIGYVMDGVVPQGDLTFIFDEIRTLMANEPDDVEPRKILEEAPKRAKRTKLDEADHRFIRSMYEQDDDIEAIAIHTGLTKQAVRRSLAESGVIYLTWHKTKKENELLTYLRDLGIYSVSDLGELDP